MEAGSPQRGSWFIREVEWVVGLRSFDPHSCWIAQLQNAVVECKQVLRIGDAGMVIAAGTHIADHSQLNVEWQGAKLPATERRLTATHSGHRGRLR